MINIPNIFKQNGSATSTYSLPLLPLRDIVVFPHMQVPLFIGREKSINALTYAMESDKRIFLATQSRPDIDNPVEKDINKTGTIGRVLQMLRLSDGTVKALVEGDDRGRIEEFFSSSDFFYVNAIDIPEESITLPEAEALIRTVLESLEAYTRHNKKIIAKEVLTNIAAITDPSKLADTIAAHMPLKIELKQRVLETIDLRKRLVDLAGIINTEIEIATVCIGHAASMGAFLLAAGNKGKRFSLPNARIMIHQPMGGTQGQASDIAIQAEEILKMKDTLNRILAQHTGKPLEQIQKDTDRDFFMSGEEAKTYGIIDHVITDRNDLEKLETPEEKEIKKK